MILLWNSSISIMGDRCNPSHHRLENGSSGHLMLIISEMKTNWKSCKDISQATEKRSSGALSWGQHHHPPNRAQHQTIRESEPVVWGQIFVHRPIIWSRRPERVWRAGSPRQHHPPTSPQSPFDRRTVNNSPCASATGQFQWEHQDCFFFYNLVKESETFDFCLRNFSLLD